MIREKQIKTRLRYHCRLVRMVTIKSLQTINASGAVEKRKPF